MEAKVWGKGNTYSFLLDVKTDAATMEISVEFPERA